MVPDVWSPTPTSRPSTPATAPGRGCARRSRGRASAGAARASSVRAPAPARGGPAPLPGVQGRRLAPLGDPQTDRSSASSGSSVAWIAAVARPVPDQLRTFERTAPPSDVSAVLDPAGYPLTSANNILVLGSDRRQKNSKEPGAEKSGPGRSDTIMLIRTGGGHSARLSIPRDTVVEIPGHGLQKINAAHAFGGPALSISVIKRWLGIPDQPRGGSQLRKLPAADRRDGRGRLQGRLHHLPHRRRLSARAATRCACRPAPTTSTASRRWRSPARARTCAPPTRPTCSARNTSRPCSTR